MAGVRARRVADDSICSSDLCVVAAESALKSVDWKPDSVDGLILVTQTPDYFLPSTSCVIHRRLGLSERCATFDVGLGCSGYPYGLWLAAMMLRSGGLNRVLLLHGDTSSRFCDKSDRSVSLLFGDAGSATALETSDPETCQDWAFLLHTDGAGWRDMIIEAGGFRNRFCNDARSHYVSMNGANVFNFTIKRVPQLIQETLAVAGVAKEQVDYFIFHQSNAFIIKHIIQKVHLPDTSVPMSLGEFGNTGGASIPLTITHSALIRPSDRSLKMMLLGYGVGLSWASALVSLEPTALLERIEIGAAGD
jgi:3-oxoacyl-[acyl-carrier-protein] synthase-3